MPSLVPHGNIATLGSLSLCTPHQHSRSFFLHQKKPWWAEAGSNRRALPCQGSVLPLNYRPIFRYLRRPGRDRTVDLPRVKGLLNH